MPAPIFRQTRGKIAIPKTVHSRNSSEYSSAKARDVQDKNFSRRNRRSPDRNKSRT